VKVKIADLAFLGGTPEFSEKLHVGKPNIGNREGFFQRLTDILDRRWLTNNGVYVQEFEDRIARLIGVKHCIAICNGTTALGIAAQALGLSGEVIIPSFTFIATAHALWWQGITPVFCDIDRTTYNIDPEEVKKKITPRTTGLIGVHLWGRPCNSDALTEIARTHSIKLLFDAAHAFGCSHLGRMIGSFGDAEVFSFHATKIINTFEGGAIVTNNDDLAKKIRLMINFGFAGFDNVISPGVNGKMNEASAAMGISNLECLDAFIEHNHENYKAYRKKLSGLNDISFVDYDEREKSNYQYIIIGVKSTCLLKRDELINILQAENIIARRYFFPGCHRMEPYRSSKNSIGSFPKTEEISERVIALPTGTTIGVHEIEGICDIIRFCIDHASEISESLRRLDNP